MTFVTMAVLAAGSASAQDPRVEISGLAGWTFSDGVTGAAATVPGVGTFNGIEPKDSFSWGLTAGFFVTSNVEVEFLFDRQASQFAVTGTSTVDIGDVSVDNYHGVLAYNFGESDAQVRPFVFGGLGATRYGTLSFTGAAGQSRELGGETQFSTTWGAGVKLYPGKAFGLRLQGRWTPTYIKSDAAGWWCDPYWGCYVLSDAQYANQFELTGGVTLRF
jgi:outer membrane protein W